MQNSLTAVVVGTGFIGPVHVEALRRGRVKVLGIVGSTPEKSQAAATQLGMPHPYASLEDALADPAVDVVHLATPNRLHFAQASAALRAGKHVLCEKPLAMNSTETRQLIEIARTSGRAAGVCYNIRYYPLCLEAAERVRSGQSGSIFHITGSYAQDWLARSTDFNWRVLAHEGGALRAVADIGTHWLDLVQFVSGCEVESVLADLTTVYPERQRPTRSVETFTGKLGQVTATESITIQTEDYGCLMLRFCGGAKGVVWVSQVSPGRKNCLRFEIAAAQQTLAWNSEIPNELWLGHRDAANQELLRDPALLSASAQKYTSFPGGHNEGFPDTFKQLFRAFYDYVAIGDMHAPPTYPTFADGHREVVLCEATLQSHREQRWVSMQEIANGYVRENSLDRDAQ